MLRKDLNSLTFVGGWRFRMVSIFSWSGLMPTPTVCVPCKQSPFWRTHFFWIYSQSLLTKAFKYISSTVRQLSIISTSYVTRYILNTWYSFQCMLHLPLITSKINFLDFLNSGSFGFVLLPPKRTLW